MNPDLSSPSLFADLAAAIEHDDATTSVHPVGSPDSVLLERGPVPIGGSWTALPQSNRARRWAEERHSPDDSDASGDSDERLWIGWPLVSGSVVTDGRAVDTQAGLIVVEAQLRSSVDAPIGNPRALDDSAPIEIGAPCAKLTINDAALELLDLPIDERRHLHRTLTAALASPLDLPALTELLRVHGLAPATAGATLAPVDHAQPISNSALAWVGRPDASPTAGPLRRDLQALGVTADEPRSGALRALVAPAAEVAHGSTEGAGSSTHGADGLALELGVDIQQHAVVTAPVEPQPAVGPITRPQEEAVSESRQAALTVAVGSAGSGKTQLALHALVAAVAAGERVVLATGNPRLAAAAHQMLRDVHPGTFPLLAAEPSSRAALGRSIDQALHHPPDGLDDLAMARASWERAAARIRPTYARLAARLDNERSLTAAHANAANRRRELDEIFPDGPALADHLRIDHQRFAATLPVAERAVAAGSAPSGRSPRARIERRGDRKQAVRAVEDVAAAIGPSFHEHWREAIATGELALVLRVAVALEGFVTARDAVASLERELAMRPERSELEHDIDASFATRLGPSLTLARASWATGLQARAAGRVPARRYQLSLTDRNGHAPSVSRELLPDVLEAFPAWVVTPSSASGYLPLRPDLFDLVVIDDAQHVDLAPGMALLARASRALVIGDADDAGTPHERPSLLAIAREHLRRRGQAPVVLGPPFRPSPPVAAFIAEHLRDRPSAAPSSTAPPAAGAAGATSVSGDGSLHPVAGLEWRHHEGTFTAGPGGRSGRNADEAIAVVDLVAEIVAEQTSSRSVSEDPSLFPSTDAIDLRHLPSDSVGVVTMLEAHRDALRDLLRERFGPRITVDLPEGFAGLERDVIIVSPAINAQAADHLVAVATERRALADALGRARSRVIVVGDHEWARSSGTALAAVAQHAVRLGASSATTG